MVCYNSPKFGDYKHCSDSEVMVLVCHVIKHVQVTKWSSNFMSGICSK